MNRRSFLARLVAGSVLGPYLPKIVRPIPPAVTTPTQTFGKFIFPVIRNMPSAFALDELVSVQPMAAPRATVMYMDFKRVGPSFFSRLGTWFTRNSRRAPFRADEPWGCNSLRAHHPFHGRLVKPE